VSDAAAPIPGDREAAVLDRITAFRRRRPRLTDDVVTLAHGAGGKASAALVDSVFLDAFADGDPGDDQCRAGVGPPPAQHSVQQQAAKQDAGKIGAEVGLP